MEKQTFDMIDRYVIFRDMAKNDTSLNILTSKQFYEEKTPNTFIRYSTLNRKMKYLQAVKVTKF